MSNLLLSALVVIGLTSCKKDKLEFVPTTVEETGIRFSGLCKSSKREPDRVSEQNIKPSSFSGLSSFLFCTRYKTGM